MTATAPLIEGLSFGGLITDNTFDSNAINEILNERGAKVIIAQLSRRASSLPLDAERYRWRHLIKNFFGKLKMFKRTAMRRKETDQS